MNDKLFFPLIIIVATMMAGLAVRKDSGRLPTGPVGGADTDYTRVVVEDTNLNRITSSSETEIVLIDHNGVNILQIRAITRNELSEPAETSHFRLAADLETQFSGHILRVIVTARSVGGDGAAVFEVNYSAGKAGNSGWRSFDLTRDFDSYSFETRVPIASGQGVDYLGVRPVLSEALRTMEIKSIVFERLERWDTGDDA